MKCSFVIYCQEVLGLHPSGCLFHPLGWNAAFRVQNPILPSSRLQNSPLRFFQTWFLWLIFIIMYLPIAHCQHDILGTSWWIHKFVQKTLQGFFVIRCDFRHQRTLNGSWTQKSQMSGKNFQNVLDQIFGIFVTILVNCLQ